METVIMTTMGRAGICGCCVVALGAWASAGLGQAPGTRSPAFTQAQVSAGSQAYRQHCASCHGAKLEGLQLAPGLTGERFDRVWRGKTADTLMFHLRRMPPAPGAASNNLGDETYASILAY